MCLAADEGVQQRQASAHHQAGLQQQHVLHVLAKRAWQRLVRTHTPHAWQQPELRAVLKRD
jgi:hypothetical protein